MKRELYTLIRTVEEQFEDGSEALIEVKAMRSATGGEAIIIGAEDIGGGILVHSRDQAERLIRAINAAGRALDWDDLPTIELAQEARERRRPAAVWHADGAKVTLRERELSYAWIAEHPKLGAQAIETAIGVERIQIKSVQVIWRDKARGIAALTVWRKGSPTAVLIEAEDEPREAHHKLASYLGHPEGVEFDFSRDGFLTIKKHLTA